MALIVLLVLTALVVAIASAAPQIVRGGESAESGPLGLGTGFAWIVRRFLLIG